jgi:hypothetical protein
VQGGGGVIEITIEGGQFVNQALIQLTAKIQRKIARGAVLEAAALIKQRIYENAHQMVKGEMGNLLGESMEVLRVKARQNSIAAFVGPSATFNPIFAVDSKEGKRNYIPAAIEFGHITRGPSSDTGMERARKRLASAAAGVGFVPAIPFMRTAFDSGAASAIEAMTDAVREGVETEAAAIGRAQMKLEKVRSGAGRAARKDLFTRKRENVYTRELKRQLESVKAGGDVVIGGKFQTAESVQKLLDESRGLF